MVKYFKIQEDFYIWNRYYPFNKKEAEEVINKIIEQEKSIGRLNFAYKAKFLKYSLEGDLKTTLTLFRALFSLSESFFIIGK